MQSEPHILDNVTHVSDWRTTWTVLEVAIIVIETREEADQGGIDVCAYPPLPRRAAKAFFLIMQRVKNVDYDEDDLYDEDNYPDEEEENQEYTAEDRENFANLTPVVRAELEESGAQATDTQIEEALWHYYWDVGKSVAYLKGSNQSSTTSSQTTSKKDKPKSKFDQAAQKNAAQAGESRSCVVPLSVEATGLDGVQVMPYDKGGSKSWMWCEITC